VGHLAHKDAYRALGRALDGLTVRVPWNETLRRLLAELYTEEEAQLVSRMPTGLASLGQVARVVGMGEQELLPLLGRLCAKGLVMDLEVGGEYRYTISPMVIGVFEFTMMRTDGRPDFKRLAGMFHDYMTSRGTLTDANFGHGERVSFMRTLPHAVAIAAEPHVEVLDHQKAQALVECAPGLTVGICSCRHEREHLGGRTCAAPLESCVGFAKQSDYSVRRGLARPADRREILELLERARELRMVFNADNVRTGVSFLCLCCGCCCNVLGGIRRFGLPNVVVTSGFLASVDLERCTGCGKCAAACPIQAIRMEGTGTPGARKPGPSEPGAREPRQPVVDTSFCIGCGVCGLACTRGAMRLLPREQRALLPENTVERVILQALERGTLQNFIVDNPNTGSGRFLRAVLAAFLGLAPVQRAIMSDVFRSRFLSRITAGYSSG
jgi:ferredoxin